MLFVNLILCLSFNFKWWLFSSCLPPPLKTAKGLSNSNASHLSNMYVCFLPSWRSQLSPAMQSVLLSKPRPAQKILSALEQRQRLLLNCGSANFLHWPFKYRPVWWKKHPKERVYRNNCLMWTLQQCPNDSKWHSDTFVSALLAFWLVLNITKIWAAVS